MLEEHVRAVHADDRRTALGERHGEKRRTTRDIEHPIARGGAAHRHQAPERFGVGHRGEPLVGDRLAAELLLDASELIVTRRHGPSLLVAGARSHAIAGPRGQPAKRCRSVRHGGEVEGVPLSGPGARPRRRDPRNLGSARRGSVPVRDRRAPAPAQDTIHRLLMVLERHRLVERRGTAASTASASASSSSARGRSRASASESARVPISRSSPPRPARPPPVHPRRRRRALPREGRAVADGARAVERRAPESRSLYGRRQGAARAPSGGGPRSPARDTRPQGLYAEHDHHAGASPA